MSCIYEIACKECGKVLDFDILLDNADDLLIKVEPCNGCMEEAADEAIKRRYEE